MNSSIQHFALFDLGELSAAFVVSDHLSSLTKLQTKIWVLRIRINLWCQLCCPLFAGDHTRPECCPLSVLRAKCPLAQLSPWYLCSHTRTMHWTTISQADNEQATNWSAHTKLWPQTQLTTANIENMTNHWASILGQSPMNLCKQLNWMST